MTDPKTELVQPTLVQGEAGNYLPTSDEAVLNESSAPIRKSIFPVVGVGASAGGLEAFTTLLQHLPTDTGMAFVLIQHLDPRHESLLGEFLAKATRMPVVEAKDGLAVEPNHIYVIPPNCSLTIFHGKLQLLPRTEEVGRHLPIDYFLCALAKDQGSESMGVILSGTGSDGTLGLQAIKAEGGITFAQDEQSAQYNGMPRSAIAAGCVDFILPPQEIAKELAVIVHHPYVRGRNREDSEVLPESADNLNKIFFLLRTRTGNDFTHYKPNTIKRRIKRRLLLHQLERLSDYVRYLQKYPVEVDALFQDLLIHVTSFFREPDTFVALVNSVFPRLFEQRPPEVPVRVWVPACSTGEEVYSIAIALLEFLGDQTLHTPIQIFGTDIDKQAIDKARIGKYPESITADVSLGRLRRFFVKTPGGYQISKAIRDLCVFAVQNVIQDPPFSRLDLICCRNLLIYLDTFVQKKVLLIFHYALVSGGYLLLGSSETIGGAADLFTLVDKKSKLYARKSLSTGLCSTFVAPAHDLAAPPRTAAALTQVPAKPTLEQAADDIILTKYGPPGVIVNAAVEILQFRGQTGPYIEPTPGAASLNLLKMVHQDLSVELRAALHQAQKKDINVRKEGIRLRHNGSDHFINLQVIPFKEPATAERYFLVLFEPVHALPERMPSAALAGQDGTLAPSDKEHRIAELEHELQMTREYLQSIIEEQEAGNEELQAASEEIQSTNEELQSTNEELETAKEELQSINEELSTVNEELENRNIELGLINSDLLNLLNSVSLPIIMLDNDLNIRQFTPVAKTLLNLIDTDVGRPFSDIRLNLDIPDLDRLIRKVIDTMTLKSLEVQDPQGHWYTLYIRPYKTVDNRVAGAVLVFVEMTQLLATVVRDSNDAITVQDFDGRILAWNRSAEALYGYTETEALSLNVSALIPESTRAEAQQLLERLRRGDTIKSFETQRLTKEGRLINVSLTLSALRDEKGNVTALATTERALTP